MYMIFGDLIADSKSAFFPYALILKLIFYNWQNNYIKAKLFK